MPRRRRHSAGFTLVELVMVMLIIGVLAAFVLPRALDLTMWRLRAYADALQSEAMALQRLALAQRRPIVATFTPGGATFAYASGEALPALPCPATATPCIAEAGARSVVFNAGHSGRAMTSTGAALAVTLSGGGTTIALVVENETGLFRPLP
ncbi:MAG: type II secretion system protein [Rubrivivax sp.]|nr:type II secretion system protein [Rubrivivax sp.]